MRSDRREWRRTRRGQIETPVVMIFSVVAGVIVLLIIGWFLLRQQSSVETNRTLSHLKGVAVAVESAGSTLNAQQNMSLIGELVVQCGDSGTELWYGDEEMRGVTGTITFGQERILGVAAIRSAPVGSAYRIGNAVYISSPRQLTSGRIVATPSPTESGAGIVSFGANAVYPYFSPALLEGANVSGNAAIYACGLSETLNRYRFANRVQWERVRGLVQEYRRTGSTCTDLYDERPFGAIENTLTGANEKTKDATAFAGNNAAAAMANAETLVRAERQIEQMNSNLVRASCVTVS